MANRAQLYRYKGDRCTSCGISVQEMLSRYGTFERLFQLHHIDPSAKDPNYKNLIRQQLSAAQIAEVDKCTLLCTQCHNILHAQNITAKLQLTVTIAERKVSQSLSGWLIEDHQEKNLRFITNQRLLLQPYLVTFGNGESKVLCCIEIEREENLLHWIRHAARLKWIEISSCINHEPLMLIEPIGPRSVKIKQKVGFPITILDVKVSGSKVDNLWFRNGCILTKDGGVYTKGTFSYNCDLL